MLVGFPNGAVKYGVIVMSFIVLSMIMIGLKGRHNTTNNEIDYSKINDIEKLLQSVTIINKRLDNIEEQCKISEQTHDAQHQRLTTEFVQLRESFGIIVNKSETPLKTIARKLTELKTADLTVTQINKTQPDLQKITNPFWTGENSQLKSNISIYKRRKSDSHATSLVSNHKCKHDYKLLILITTHASHFNRRQTIRNTWGTDPVNHRWKTYFLIGKTSNNQNLQMLENEINTHNDLIISDVYEDFYNLTAKVQSGFEWAVRYCEFQYLIKGDDDVFINMPTAFTYLDSDQLPKTELYAGNVQYQAYVLRNGRYGIAYHEFKGAVYPRYCSGGAFILSSDVVTKMYKLFPKVRAISIDDAYIGILALKAGVDATHSGNFRFFENEEACDYKGENIVHHPVKTQQCMEKLFKLSLGG